MDEDDFDALAGEFVLGLLAGDDHIHAEALRKSNPEFAAAVAGWECRLLVLAEQIAPATPPPALYARIEAAIAPPRAEKPQSAILWRPFAAALAGAMLLAIIVIWRAASPSAHEVATLQATCGGGFVVDASATALIIHPAGLNIPAGKSAELWFILPGQAPKPEGVMDATHSLSAALPPAGALLAFTLEQPGGSPTGLPQGPIIAKGTITNL